MRALALVLVLIAGGCAAVKQEAKGKGITEAQQIMQDIAADATAVAPCAVSLLPTVAAVYAGDWGALISEGACLVKAVQLIIEQVKGGAIPPDTSALLKVQTAKTLYKATLSAKPVP